MKKYIVLFLFVCAVITGCSNASTITLSEDRLSLGGSAAVVSFVNEVSYRVDRLLGRQLIEHKSLKPEKAKKVDVAIDAAIDDDLKDLYNNDEDNEDESKGIKAALAKLNISEGLVRSFIIEFRRRKSNFKLSPNIVLSKKDVSFFKEDDINTSLDHPSRRDFSKFKKDIGGNLVFELRIHEIIITSDKPNDESLGFLSTWAVLIRTQGILHDIKTGSIIWRSREIENWSDTGTIAFNSLLGDNAKILRQTFARVLDYSGKRIAILFFKGE